MKAVLAQLRYYPVISVDRLRKTTKTLRTVSVPAEIGTENLLNISRALLRYATTYVKSELTVS
jgi:hypothetical protein